MMKNKLILNGFTLIELLVVISIIGILTALSLFALKGVRESSRDSRRKADLEMIRSGLEIYKSDCNSYPLYDFEDSDSLTGENCSPPNTNTYIQLVPKDPLTGESYSWSWTSSTYTLCATLEQSTTAYCVSNP